MKTVETSFSVRYAETDQMGIVYHANYYVWFEVGRTEFFKSAGLPYWEIEKQGVFLPVIEGFCRYRRSARFGDTVIVKTKVQDMKPTRLKLTYEVFRQHDGTLLAEGYTEHAFVDKDGRPLNLKKSHPHIWEVLDKLQNFHPSS
ncbi:putative esterase [Fervidicola ferrireducens]|uniref:Putative esterase n=1 Tax=Fervidicola ferrireducens TaxID=520764 RepID=A0A140LDE2_9FIRM|nr:thioesterase family protein [Fervidicola ferrireducens]KXG78567.1 putative esterase [Fervidicola ferrireducens]